MGIFGLKPGPARDLFCCSVGHQVIFFHRITLQNHQPNISQNPSLLDAPLIRRLLLQGSPSRERECSALRSRPGREPLRNRRTSTLLFQVLRYLSASPPAKCLKRSRFGKYATRPLRSSCRHASWPCTTVVFEMLTIRHRERSLPFWSESIDYSKRLPQK